MISGLVLHDTDVFCGRQQMGLLDYGSGPAGQFTTPLPIKTVATIFFVHAAARNDRLVVVGAGGRDRPLIELVKVIVILVGKYRVTVLIDPLLLCDSLGSLEKVTFFVELEELLVAILCEPCLDQTAQDEFNLVNDLLIDHRVDLVAHVPNVFSCRREPMSVLHLGKHQWLRSVFAPLSYDGLKLFPLV